jgi:hypothetical protein
MRPVPSAVQASYMVHLKNSMVPDNTRSYYLKWLRYYLDFCEKYRFPPWDRESVAHFLRKLQEKKQLPGPQSPSTEHVKAFLTFPQSIRRFPLQLRILPSTRYCSSIGMS